MTKFDQVKAVAQATKNALTCVRQYLEWAVGNAQVSDGAYQNLIDRLREYVAEARRLREQIEADLQPFQESPTDRDAALYDGCVRFGGGCPWPRGYLEGAITMADNFLGIVEDGRHRPDYWVSGERWLEAWTAGEKLHPVDAEELRRQELLRLADEFGYDYRAMMLAVDDEVERIAKTLEAGDGGGGGNKGQWTKDESDKAARVAARVLAKEGKDLTLRAVQGQIEKAYGSAPSINTIRNTDFWDQCGAGKTKRPHPKNAVISSDIVEQAAVFDPDPNEHG